MPRNMRSSSSRAQSRNKFFQLHFSYYGADDMMGEFFILCRARDKEQAMAFSKKYLDEVTKAPKKFLNNIPCLRVDLEWIAEFEDVQHPVIIGQTEHEGDLSMSSSEPVGSVSEAGVEVHYLEGEPITDDPSSLFAGAVSMLFWEREQENPKHPTFSNFAESLGKGRQGRH
jgi:hypothetical protein